VNDTVGPVQPLAQILVSLLRLGGFGIVLGALDCPEAVDAAARVSTTAIGTYTIDFIAIPLFSPSPAKTPTAQKQFP
jgi:hypothetical protein